MTDDRPTCSAAFLWGVALLALASLILRGVAGWEEPWLDEIWSWDLATSGHVLAAHDNNHLLNTLWLATVGDWHVPILWRLPALLSGGASVVLAALILRRSGTPHAILGAALLTFCFPLIVYQSEARGYGTMLMCLLAAFHAQLLLFDEPRRRRPARLVLALACGVGVLSHLSFALVYPFLLAWAVIWSAMTRRSAWAALMDHLAAAAIVGAWVAVFGLRMNIGGGPQFGAGAVVRETATLMTGWPHATGAAAVAACVLCAGGAAMLLKGRLRAAAWVWLAVALLYPLTAWALGPLTYVRYFLPAILCGLLLMAAAAGELWQRRPAVRPILAVAVLAWAVAQSLTIWPVLADGRNQHAAALRRVASEPGATLGSNGEFQLRLITQYHVPELLSRVRPVADLPDFLVVMQPAKSLQAPLATSYSLDADFPGTWAGVGWRLYRRKDSTLAAIE